MKDDSMCITAEDMKKYFFSLFPKEDCNKNYGDCDQARVFVDGDRKQVYFLLAPEDNGSLYRLEFWIDTYADNRGQLQTKLRDLVKAHMRTHELLSYYSALGCRLRTRITSKEDLGKDLKDLRGFVERLIGKTAENKFAAEKTRLGIVAMTLKEVLALELSVPDYQRAYCWRKENIVGLLNDVTQWQLGHKDGAYHIGTLVLKERKDVAGKLTYDIIDGQQRLTTLCIYLSLMDNSPNRDLNLGRNNSTSQAKKCLIEAKRTIEEWIEVGKADQRKTAKIDADRLRFSVVVIGSDEPDDLAFRFFNHINSMGKPLTDYELLKGHHLRYMNGDVESKIMADRWKYLDPIKSDLLHYCLFRIRRWLERDENFSPYADELQEHTLFREFSLDFEPDKDIHTFYKPCEIDSMISGGMEFFNYVEMYRSHYVRFVQHESVKKLELLKWHSSGVLYRGILALSFFFYCKFGDIYLSKAIKEIARAASVLRNERSLRRSSIARPIFSNLARLIDRATQEGEFFGSLKSTEFSYARATEKNVQMNYWNVLDLVINEKKPDISKEKENAD